MDFKCLLSYAVKTHLAKFVPTIAVLGKKLVGVGFVSRRREINKTLMRFARLDEPSVDEAYPGKQMDSCLSQRH